ncbi:MAG TPA: phosphodiester glycosidase family protein [Gaiellaceae bacterium]
MLRRTFLLVAFAAVLLPSAASGGTEVMPGVVYSRQVIVTSAGKVVLHVLVAPKPGGLYALKPVLSNGRVTGRERVSSIQRRLSRRATLAGVNGDLFNWTTGHPSGIFLRANVLATKPMVTRSSLGIGIDGLLRVGAIGYWGQWRVDGFPAHPFFELNRPLRYRKGVALYTPLWGARTPHRREAREFVLAHVGPIHPNADIRAEVVSVRRGSELPIPAGGAVLQATGDWRFILGREARPGRWLTLQADLKNWWDGVRDAIGGGPLLVRDGVAVHQAGENFTTTQLLPHDPRTAVGQRADGRIVLLVADGRWSGSAGLTTAQLANQMVRLGAVTAMALDSGGSSTMAVDGAVLNRPSDGSERAIGDALMVLYYGAYARKPRWPTFSPNGDEYADAQRLYAKFVRPADIRLRLIRPDGTTHWDYTASVSPGTITRDLRSPSLMEGTWRWVISAVDRHGEASVMERKFRINNTLGFVALSKSLMRVRTGIGGRLRIGFRLAHAADVTATIRRRGHLVRRLVSQSLGPGDYAVIWNGRNAAGNVVRSGVYLVVVKAVNELGPVSIKKKIVVRRVS